MRSIWLSCYLNYMDPFLIIGDLLHILSICFLLLRIIACRNVSSLSYRTQEMFLVVFLTRFSDMIIFHHHFLLYLVVTRTVLIGTSIATISYFRFIRPHAKTYDRNLDSFPHLWIYLFSALIAISLPEHQSLYGYLWTFSIWAEAGTIIPQLFMLIRESIIANITVKYVLMLALYRAMYILHWMFSWETIKMHSMIAGILQTLLYSSFIYLFMVKQRQQKFMALPS